MSGDSVNEKESEDAVSENNVEETGKKLKRNYCYVCEVQCTCLKNFQEHQKGKKHQKKLSLAEKETKEVKTKKNRNNSQKNTPKPSKPLATSKRKTNKSKAPDIQDSHTNTDNVTERIVNNSKRQTPSNRRSQCINPDYDSLAEAKKKSSESVKNKNNSRKNNAPTPKTLIPNKKKSNKSRDRKQDSEDSLTNADDSTKRTMNNSNRQTPRNKRYQYINPDHDRYSRYQNSKYSYSNNYQNQECYGNSGPYCDFPGWNNAMYSANTPVPELSYNFGFANQQWHDYGYNAPYRNDSFSENRYAVFNSSGNLDRNTYLPVSSENSKAGSSSYYNPVNNETSEARETELNSSCLENSEKSNGNITLDEKSSTEIAEPIQNVKVTLNNSTATSALDADKNVSNTSQASCQFSKSNIAKQDKNKRIRSRSLSSSENFSSGKRTKEKTENQSLDSDSASEEQRIKEWTDSLLDTSHNKISRLLHPSNYKEKAAVNHLITKFSKSKRKENLTRNIRSNSLGSTEMNEDETDDANRNFESSSMDFDEVSIILDSDENNSSFEQSDNCTLAEKKISEKNCGSQTFCGTSNRKSPTSVPIDHKSKSPNKRDARSKGDNLRTCSRKSSENRKEKSSFVNSEKNKKRKDSNDNIFPKGKKQKFYSPPECSEQPVPSKITELEDLIIDASVVENSPKYDSLKTASTEPALAEEMPADSDVNPSTSTTTDSQNVLNQNFEITSDISVETLIQLFASGHVKVKEEFNDPVMDAIKGISPDELISAYSNLSYVHDESETTETPMESNLECSIDKPSHVTPVETSNSVTLQSTVNNVNMNPISVSNSSFEKSDDQSLASKNNNVDKNSNNSLPEMKNFLHKTQSELPSHVNKLINQLQEISSQEEVVKTNLAEAKVKISEINFLLEEWKRKKKKLQDKEEDLRKQRNVIITALQSAVKTDDDKNEIKTSTPEKEKINQSSFDMQMPFEHFKETEENTFEKIHNSSMPVSSVEKKQKEKKNKTLIPSESEEIVILPLPVKPKPPEITILDDIEEDGSSSNSKATRSKIVTNVLSSNESSFFDEKDITAHATVINCLVVFEDFLYTCSNDNTGKRFSLKDSSLTVTYHHSAKNVTEIVVEKVQNEALVLTSCSTRVISLFIASNGTKIKSFFPLCAVMSICKGWGKFYAGLANGSVNVYNWKYEEREVVKTESPAARIDTAHQGRLHVLVILSSDGNIAIRDAETGLLIRYIKLLVKHPSWMNVYNDLAYLSSSDKSLIILDIMSGRVEKRLYLSNHTTGLAVCEDYIFTISYSGVINCFNKDKGSDKLVYYGAGKNGLTCIHVYQDWVFTGNRKGNVSLFQFDPCSPVACKFGKCDVIYGLKEDLEYHVEKDHLLKKKNLSRCSWHGCEYLFPRISDVNEKMDHLKKHIHQGHL